MNMFVLITGLSLPSARPVFSDISNNEDNARLSTASRPILTTSNATYSMMIRDGDRRSEVAPLTFSRMREAIYRKSRACAKGCIYSGYVLF
jgi:hypothetical protein